MAQRSTMQLHQNKKSVLRYQDITRTRRSQYCLTLFMHFFVLNRFQYWQPYTVMIKLLYKNFCQTVAFIFLSMLDFANLPIIRRETEKKLDLLRLEIGGLPV